MLVNCAGENSLWWYIFFFVRLGQNKVTFLCGDVSVVKHVGRKTTLPGRLCGGELCHATLMARDTLRH